MQKFQELLTEAAQLKEAQLKNQRKNYQSLPDYLKSGLNYSRKFQQLRKQDFLIQISISEKLKKQGNQLFKIEHYQQALAKYEESLGIFRFIAAKSYENMKDEDLVYENYVLPQDKKQHTDDYNTHLIALYLNICSCLSKLNKKEDAIHSADQAIKIKETAKAYYKKAQAYLQFINKEASDIKLGFYYLNKSYQLSKDPSIIQQMHKIKKDIDQERDKQKKWFKFMFDKNSQVKKQSKPFQEEKKTSEVKKEGENNEKEGKRLLQITNLQKQKGVQHERQDTRLEKTKEKLSIFADLNLSDEEWLDKYQGQFIAKHGSKIYSIIQLYGYKEYLGQYKSLLAQCLQFKKSEQQIKRKQLYLRYFQWLKDHPIDKISKYTQRYDLQTKWVREERAKKLNNNVLEQIQIKKDQQAKQQPKQESKEPNKEALQPQIEKNLESNKETQTEQNKTIQKQQTTEKNIEQTKNINNIKLKSFIIALVIMFILIIFYML